MALCRLALSNPFPIGGPNFLCFRTMWRYGGLFFFTVWRTSRAKRTASIFSQSTCLATPCADTVCRTASISSWSNCFFNFFLIFSFTYGSVPFERVFGPCGGHFFNRVAITFSCFCHHSFFVLDIIVDSMEKLLCSSPSNSSGGGETSKFANRIADKSIHKTSSSLQDCTHQSGSSDTACR